MAENQRRHSIGKRHVADDLGADLRVGLDLLELLLREPARLRQDVLGNRQLPDVVEKCSRLHPLDLAVAHTHRLRQAGRVGVYAADVVLRCLIILGVDRDGEGLDGGEVQIGHLLHVAFMFADVGQVGRAGPGGEVEEEDDQWREQVPARSEKVRDAERA